MKYLISVVFLLSCHSQGELGNKLLDVSKTKYWKVIKWNSGNYSDDTLLLRFYPNSEYDLFRINKKKGIVVSLKPGSSSDIVAYQFWSLKGDSLLSFKKKVDFHFSFTSHDTLWFVNTRDSLIIAPFSLSSTYGH